MGLRFVEYRRRQWVLRYRDPWSGKQRIKSFSTEGEARQFESVQAEMHIRERELMRRARRRMSSASATKGHGRGAPLSGMRGHWKTPPQGVRRRSMSNR